MIIDVSERIDTAKRLTTEWASAAGYQLQEDGPDISKVARDLQRLMGVSSFGCQQKNVHAILQVLINEKFPIGENGPPVDYARKARFVIGSALVPTRPGSERVGIVARLSQQGNAGLRLSNGDQHTQHWSQEQVRPATPEEIDTYYAEMFGLAVNPADDLPEDELPNDDDDHPF